MKKTLAVFMSIVVAGALHAQAQVVPLHVGTTNSVVDEFGAVLKGTGPGAPFFGFPYVTGEVVQILHGNSGIFPPNSDGTPNTNNPILAEFHIGDGVDPSIGPVGMFGGSIAQRPSGQVFARVFNKSSLSDVSFYTDSQLFTVPTTNYDVFIANLQRTIDPTDPSDPDGDGLHNSWEKSMASNPGNPDSDGDGMADGPEFRAGTGITDENSLLMMVELMPASGSDLQVIWDSVTGKQYQIEYTAEDLRNNPAYTNVSDVISATSTVSATTITNGLLQPAGHYRVRLVE